MTKNARLPKISIQVKFRGEMLAPLCSDDSIQNILILPWLLTFGTKAKLEEFVSEHKGAHISHPNCNRMLIFGESAFFVMPFTNI